MIELPPLSERREDIPLLVQHFFKLIEDKTGRKISCSADALEKLVSAPWPGNVRQLYNVIEQVCALSTTDVISSTLVQKALKQPSNEIMSYARAKERFERDYLVHLLQLTGGKVSHAARLANRNRTEFYRLLGRNNIDPRLFKPGS